jgi:hypothetical protein
VERKNEVRQWYKQLKATSKCITCGVTHPTLIEFHHTDPETKRCNISQMVYNGYAIGKIEDELKKCVPVCKNHHALLHWDEPLYKVIDPKQLRIEFPE